MKRFLMGIVVGALSAGLQVGRAQGQSHLSPKVSILWPRSRDGFSDELLKIKVAVTNFDTNTPSGNTFVFTESAAAKEMRRFYQVRVASQ